MNNNLEFFDWMKKNYNRDPNAKDQMDCWLAGQQDKIPKIWYSYFEKFQQEKQKDKEYDLYLKLRDKYEKR